MSPADLAERARRWVFSGNFPTTDERIIDSLAALLTEVAASAREEAGRDLNTALADAEAYRRERDAARADVSALRERLAKARAEALREAADVVIGYSSRLHDSGIPVGGYACDVAAGIIERLGASAAASPPPVLDEEGKR